MSFVLSSRSEVKLVMVHPHLVKVVRRAIQVTEVDFVVIEGMRTFARQKELCALGKSQTLNSRHMHGLAVDVAAFVDRKISWEMKYYRQIAAAFAKAADELKIPVEWGGNWKTFKDGPHFQLNKYVYPDGVA